MTARINRKTPLVEPSTGVPTLYGWSILQDIWRATGGEQSVDGTELKVQVGHIPRDPDADLTEPSPLPPRQSEPDLEPVPLFITPAQAGAGGGATVVHKTADESLASSTTLQNDDHLLFEMVASRAYAFELVLLLENGNISSDWKFGWSVPTGATMHWGSAPGEPSVIDPWSRVDALDTPATLLTETDTEAHGAAASGGNIHGLIFKGVAVCGATAGALQFQWAQATSDTSANTVKKHSHMTIRELGDS